jgi:hypothetical protein
MLYAAIFVQNIYIFLLQVVLLSGDPELLESSDTKAVQVGSS